MAMSPSPDGRRRSASMLGAVSRKARIVKAGDVLGRHKMVKYFVRTVTDTSFAFTRKTAAIAREAAPDDFYVPRTNVPADMLVPAATGRID